MANHLNLRSIEEYEKISEDEAKQIFKELCELNDNQNTIDLNFIRRLLSINNQNYSDLFLKFITQYKLIDSMKNGKFSKDTLHNHVFNEDEFVNFITGKDTKELLFDDNIDLAQKRFNIDEYTKLYELIRGDQREINKSALVKNIEEVIRSLSIGNDEYTLHKIAEEQANEIIELLGSSEDCLTPEDFMNIMTSNTPLPDNFEDIL